VGAIALIAAWRTGAAAGEIVSGDSYELAAERGRKRTFSETVARSDQGAPWLKTIPADLFLRIMNGGYSRALGVSCTHCHVEEDFSSDEKRPKRAAREMARMHRMINEQLQKMENLERPADERSINCSTCHRGAVSPLNTNR
jgi:formate-dependent nitrite reductase cytochrome c552 subunit